MSYHHYTFGHFRFRNALWSSTSSWGGWRTNTSKCCNIQIPGSPIWLAAFTGIQVLLFLLKCVSRGVFDGDFIEGCISDTSFLVSFLCSGRIWFIGVKNCFRSWQLKSQSAIVKKELMRNYCTVYKSFVRVLILQFFPIY